MRIRLADAPHLVALMSAEDQRTYGAGIHPVDDPHPPIKTDRAEKEEQRQFANYCLLHDLPFCWHATNARSRATPGTPDFWIGINRVGAWVEFKRDPSCQLSEEQQEFGRKLEAQGMRLYVVYSAAEAIALLQFFNQVI